MTQITRIKTLFRVRTTSAEVKAQNFLRFACKDKSSPTSKTGLSLIAYSSKLLTYSLQLKTFCALLVRINPHLQEKRACHF
jgi:hypothetical protein